MNNTTSAPAIGLPTALLIVFVTLKLTGNIGWPWVWVLAPLWLPLALVGAFLAVSVLISVIVMVVKR
jgi:hypothetical protein